MAATRQNLMRTLGISLHERDIEEAFCNAGLALIADRSLRTYLLQLWEAEKQFSDWRSAIWRFDGTGDELEALLDRGQEVDTWLDNLQRSVSKIYTQLAISHDHDPSHIQENLSTIAQCLEDLNRLLTDGRNEEAWSTQSTSRSSTLSSEQISCTSSTPSLADRYVPQHRVQPHPEARAQSTTPPPAPAPVNRKRYKKVLVEGYGQLQAGDKYKQYFDSNGVVQQSGPTIPTETIVDLAVAKDNGVLHLGNTYESMPLPMPMQREDRRGTDFSGVFDAQNDMYIGNTVNIGQVNLPNSLKRRTTVATVNRRRHEHRKRTSDVKQ